MLYDYVASFCSDLQVDSPNRIQHFSAAFSLVLRVLQEGSARDVRIPTEQLCSVLFTPEIFEENYKEVLAFTLYFAKNYTVASVIMPALAEKLVDRALTLESIRETTGVFMRSLLAVGREGIEGHFQHFIERICDYAKKRDASDCVSAISSLLATVAAFGGESLKDFIAGKTHIQLHTTQLATITPDLSTIIERVVTGLKAGNLDLEAFPQVAPVCPVIGSHISYQEVVQELIYLLGKGKKELTVEDTVSYSGYFEDLLGSPLLLYLRESGYRQYVTQYIVSKLSRLFSWDMNLDDRDFLRTLEKEVLNLYFSPERKLSTSQLWLAGSILSSQAVLEAYSEDELTPVAFENWKEEIYFVPLEGAHGVTVFGGSVLINEQYSSEKGKDTAGFIFTLLHESAHLARKVKDGVYDIELKTPMDKVKKTQPQGMPGNPEHQRPILGTDNRFGEGGIEFECTLFGAMITKLSKQQITFLQEGKNWRTDLETFHTELFERGVAEPVEVVEYGSRTQKIFSFSRDSHLGS